MANINTTVLMSSAEYFGDDFAINPYMDASVPVDVERAIAEHKAVAEALQTAGVTIKYVAAPKDCQDGVYAANWGLGRGDTVILSSLPNKRQAEQPHAKAVLEGLGKKVIEAPYRFSGQGDALPCGNYVFMGSEYRTDPRMRQFVADTLGYDVIGLQTIPYMDEHGHALTNVVTGWPDSFFYDIDLALSVLREDLIAWCPDAFMPESRERLEALPIEKIEVSLDEAMQGFACNLVSTGEVVVMSAHAPQFQAALQARGFTTLTPGIHELAKGGGYIRCTTLTLDNR